ncbi:MFS transporter [Streptomyces sp. BBFR102]|uniref:MFS transporter n=1 Tax=Streptomyces sp. BBFR102 TaxID=3448171 RepID=UPI003F535B23
MAISSSGQDPEQGRAAHGWTVVAVAGAAIVTAGAFTTFGGLLLVPLHEERGWSRASIGVAFAISTVLYGVTAPFAAALTDRFGVRRVLVGALLLAGGGAAGTGVAGSPAQVAVAWGLGVGLGTGAASTALAAGVAERSGAGRRGLVAGLLTAAGVVGQFVFLPVLSQVVEAYGWQAAAWGLAGAAGLVAVGALVVLRGARARGHAGAGAGTPGAGYTPPFVTRALRVLTIATRRPAFWLLAGVFAVCGASTNGLLWNHFTPAAHDHGMPATSASTLLALVGVFNVAGTIAAGRLTDRVDPRRVLAACFGLRALALVSLPLLWSPSVGVPLVAFAVLFGLLDVATVPPTLALCRVHFGQDAVVVFGWVNAAHQLGAGTMAHLGGLTRDAFGSYDPVWAGAGALCAGAAVLAGVVRGGRTDRPERPSLYAPTPRDTV